MIPGIVARGLYNLILTPTGLTVSYDSPIALVENLIIEYDRIIEILRNPSITGSGISYIGVIEILRNPSITGNGISYQNEITGLLSPVISSISYSQ